MARGALVEKCRSGLVEKSTASRGNIEKYFSLLVYLYTRSKNEGIYHEWNKEYKNYNGGPPVSALSETDGYKHAGLGF